jgi:hypothetical protein
MDVTPRIGLPVEVAVWLTGRETDDMIERFKRDCMAELGRFGLERDCVMGPATFVEKLPGEDRVPQVPAHVSGPAVRLLVCEAHVVATGMGEAVTKATGFVYDLDRRDLERLRKITRRAYQRRHPEQAMLTDAECDAIIEEIGPESAIKTLRGGVDSKELH